MLHVVCTQFHMGHLSVRVGDSSRRSEEIVKNLELCLWKRLLLLLLMVYLHYISRVLDQNGVSLLYIVLEIHHSGQEPSITCLKYTILARNPRYVIEDCYSVVLLVGWLVVIFMLQRNLCCLAMLCDSCDFSMQPCCLFNSWSVEAVLASCNRGIYFF